MLTNTLGEETLSWWETIAPGDIVRAKKPAPDIYQDLLPKMDLPPQDCLAIEENPQGNAAAIAAGPKIVITLNDYTRDDDFTWATLVLNHLGEATYPFKAIVCSSR